MSLRKTTNPLNIRHWLGDMEADYIYTLGVAGERFLREIQKNERIMGAKCPGCKTVYVPPRTYCERCFRETKEWISLGSQGRIHTFTIATIDVDGNRLAEPAIYALITFEGACGGLVHRVAEVSPEELHIGMDVEAVFKPPPERETSINDIRYFKPVM